MSRAWWVCAREKVSTGWHWRRFLKGRGYDWYEWGGPKWIRSPASFLHIREMRKGDLVFAQQSGEGLVGMTRLASDGYASHGDEPYDIFDLDPTERVWFEHPLPFKVVRALPGAETEIEAARTWRPTVRAVTRKGVDLLIRAIGEANPDQRGDVRRFARRRAR